MNAQAAARSELSGKRIAITGRLACMRREQAVERIERVGGIFVRRVGADTDHLVVGQEGWPLRRDGRPTRSLRAAEDLRDRGYDIQILSEAQFLELLGEDGEGGQRLYTSEQLSRILGVPHAELRAWIRHSLVRPVKTVRRLCYFDFEQVAGARTLHQLRRSGVSAGRLRSSLRQLERWLPNADRGLSQLDLLEEGGRLLLRLDDGRMAEPSGQLQLDFGESAETTVSDDADRPGPKILAAARDWFELAAQHEEAGELSEAARAYHKALRHGDASPEACFNLGNVLYALGRIDASAQRFQQAVELDGEYVEAWNNLGNVCSELGLEEDAAEAYREALRLEPHYADAHYNFGECLYRGGKHAEAREHFLQYLHQDPDSVWSDRVRELLEQIENEEKPPAES